MHIIQTPLHDTSSKFTAAQLSDELHALASMLAVNEKTAFLEPQIRGAANTVWSVYKAL